jgi:hypothetical protein
MRKGATLLLAVAVAFWLCGGPSLVFAGDASNTEGKKEVKEGANLVKKGAEQIVEGGTKQATGLLDSIPWYATPIGIAFGFLLGFVMGKMGGKKKPSGPPGDKKK